MNQDASPTPDWDLMREELIAGHSFEELKRISLDEGARCSHCAKVDLAAGIVANRRRVFLGKAPLMDEWGRDYKKIVPAYTSPYCGDGL